MMQGALDFRLPVNRETMLLVYSGQESRLLVRLKIMSENLFLFMLPLDFLQLVTEYQDKGQNLLTMLEKIESMVAEGCNKKDIGVHFFKLLNPIMDEIYTRLDAFQVLSSQTKLETVELITMVFQTILKLLSKSIESKLLFSRQSSLLKRLVANLKQLPPVRHQVLLLEAIYRITPKNKHEILKLGLQKEFCDIKGQEFQFTCRDYLMVIHDDIPTCIKGKMDGKTYYVDLDWDHVFLVNLKKQFDYSDVCIVGSTVTIGTIEINFQPDQIKILQDKLGSPKPNKVSVKTSEVSMNINVVPTETNRFLDEKWSPVIKSPKLSPILGNEFADNSDEILLAKELFDFQENRDLRAGTIRNGSIRQSGESGAERDRVGAMQCSPEWDKCSLLTDFDKHFKSTSQKDDNALESQDLNDLFQARSTKGPKVKNHVNDNENVENQDADLKKDSNFDMFDLGSISKPGKTKPQKKPKLESDNSKATKKYEYC